MNYLEHLFLIEEANAKIFYGFLERNKLLSFLDSIRKPQDEYKSLFFEYEIADN